MQVHEGKQDEGRLRSTLVDLKKDLEEVKKKYERMFEEEEKKFLMGDDDEDDDLELGQTRSLLKNKQVLDQSGHRIEQSRRIMDETEARGAQTLKIL
jgi:hypothetical protein